MPKKKTPEIKPEEQFKRFVETAEKLGVDEATAAKAFKKLKPVQTAQQPSRKNAGLK